MIDHTPSSIETAVESPTDLLEIDDLTAAELSTILDRSASLKSGTDLARLPDRTLSLLFEKPSTRTRVSFETGMAQLGGHAIFLGPDEIHLGHGEPLKDTARALSGYVDAIVARLFDHEDLRTLAEYASVPVINGLTDRAHPCQTLADLLTLRETFGGLDVTVAWIGAGNNVARSFALGCALADIELIVATPEGYGFDEALLKRAASIGRSPTMVQSPRSAVLDADVVYTDVWVSMGQEGERAERLAAFEGYQMNSDLLAGTDSKVMHCLPAHRGEEITDEVLESDRALVWRQAENRLHTQKGLLVELLGP